MKRIRLKHSLCLVWSITLIISLGALNACEDNYHPSPLDTSGKIVISLSHQVAGQSLEKNQLIYKNAAGNQYMVTELKYFISDLILYRNQGKELMITDKDNIFYIDDDIPSTMNIEPSDAIPSGDYDSVAFTFGLSEKMNKSNAFLNPPESNMFWPEVLGGGYHYMMLNGKWKDSTGTVVPFNFHLGIGQLYHGSGHDVDSIYTFVQNYFRVTLPHSSFRMNEKGVVYVILTMNLESWFESPHVYDHNYWGGAVMQNQDALATIRENGYDVFSVSIKK